MKTSSLSGFKFKVLLFFCSPLHPSVHPHTYLSEWHLNPKSKHGEPQEWRGAETPQITATNETLIDYSLANITSFEVIEPMKEALSSANPNQPDVVVLRKKIQNLANYNKKNKSPMVGSPSCDSCRRCDVQTLSHTAYIYTACLRCGWSYEPSPGPGAWMIDCRSHRCTAASLSVRD